MSGKGGRSFVTPGSDSRGNSNLNWTKKHQSQKIKKIKKNVKRRKKTQKALTAICKAKHYEWQDIISQATAFKVAWIPKEKHTFTIKKKRGEGKSSGKIDMET